MTAEKEAVAQRMAHANYYLEPDITHIFTLLENPESEALPGTPIKLLSVNASSAPIGIMPLHFGPAPATGFPYPWVIIEVTPEEFARIQRQELKLPNGWTLGVEFPKPPASDEDE